VALLVTMIVFVIVRLTPGDPAQAQLGEEASPQAVAALRQKLGLDQPLPVQYVIYLGNLVHGDLGFSIKSHEPVAEAIANRLPATLELAIASLLFALVIAIPAGIIGALRRDSATGLVATMVPLLGVSLPNFFVAIVLILLFALNVRLFPPGGFTLLTDDFGDGLRHLVLPAITLGAVTLAITMRLTRSSLIEVLTEDYVRTARSKGLTGRLVMLRHALRPALLPIVTAIGLQIALLLEGGFVTESIFAWPGIGRLAVDGIFQRDYPIVQGVVLFAALITMVSGLLVDVLYVYIDPRISYTSGDR
jgi:peptide/nickel transport system permease protein